VSFVGSGVHGCVRCDARPFIRIRGDSRADVDDTRADNRGIREKRGFGFVHPSQIPNQIVALRGRLCFRRRSRRGRLRGSRGRGIGIQARRRRRDPRGIRDGARRFRGCLFGVALTLEVRHGVC
jgi:hypothetical protein